MRTEHVRHCLRQLSAMNDDLAVGMFLGHQFRIDHIESGSHPGGAMIAGEFPSNPYGPKHNRRMSTTEQWMAQYERFILTGSFVFLWALLDDYYKALVGWTGRVVGRRLEDRRGYLKALGSFVGFEGDQFPSREVEASFHYLRLRRNCLVHRRGVANGALEETCRRHGRALNAYWSGRFAKSPLSTDFALPPAGIAGFGEVVDAIRVGRAVSADLDAAVLRELDPGEIAWALWADFPQRGNLGITEDRRRRGFRTFCRQKLAWDVPDAIMDTLPVAGPVA